MAGWTYADQAEVAVPAPAQPAPVPVGSPAAVLALQRQISNAAVVGSYNSQAVRVEYFKQGPTYSNRALGGFDDDPDHVICPGEGGCRFLYNLRKLEGAIR